MNDVHTFPIEDELPHPIGDAWRREGRCTGMSATDYVLALDYARNKQIGSNSGRRRVS